MAQFKTNAQRFDPYKNFKFRVLFDGRVVLGVSKVSALKRTTEVISHRSGGDDSFTSKSKGKTTFDAITMERGVTHDVDFDRWADRVSSFAGDATIDLVNYKRQLTMEVLNERGQVALRYFLYDCWVSEYTAHSDLDANSGGGVLLESMKVELNGWARDPATPEPNESAAVPSGG